MKPLFFFLLFTLAACTSTVRPKITRPTVASFEGTNQTSGVVGRVPDGVLVTLGWVDKYNLLCGSYGTFFVPAVKPWDGLKTAPIELGTNLFIVDQEHLADMISMNRWRVSGVAPAR